MSTSFNGTFTDQTTRPPTIYHFTGQWTRTGRTVAWQAEVKVGADHRGTPSGRLDMDPAHDALHAVVDSVQESIRLGLQVRKSP